MSLYIYLNILLNIKFWVSLVLILIFHSILKLWSLKKRMPPGPTPWPLIGNLLLFRGMKMGTHEITLKLSEKYGDIFTLFFAHTPCVVITKYETAKTVLSQTIFSSRKESVLVDLIFNGSQDVIFTKYSPIWQLLRKTVTKSMRAVVESEKLENQILETVDDAIENMLKQSDNTKPSIHMRHITYNIIASLAFGKTYKLDDPELRKLNYLNDEGSKAFVNMLVFDFIPYAKYIPLRMIPAVKKGLHFIQEFKNLRQRYINEHRRTYAEGDPRDMCDALLNEQELLRKEQADGTLLLDDEHVSWAIMDFFNAGTDTTSSMLIWFLLYMVMYPDIQEECYKMIKEAIEDKPPTLRDRSKLPFVDACIMETLRLRPAAPMGVPHAPTCDTQIGEYFIPRDTIIMANIYAMHIDEDYWENPLQFDPRLHFLDENGHLKKPASFAPFGFGRRVCIGEQLARNDMFLIVTRLLQTLKFQPIQGITYNADYDVKVDLACIPVPFNVRVSRR